MLLWRPSERNKYLFLFELVIVSTLAHVILGILLFVSYKGGTSSFRVELGKSHSPTLFMPLRRHATVGRARGNSLGRAQSRSKESGSRVSQNLEPACESSTSASEQKVRLGSDTTIGWDQCSDKAKHGQIKQGKIKKNAKNLKAKQQVHTKKEIKSKERHISKTEPMGTKKNKVLETIITPVKQLAKEEKQVAPLDNPATIQSESSEAIQELSTNLQHSDSNDLPVLGPAEEQEVGADSGDYFGADEITIGQGYAGEYVTAEQARMYECVEQEIVSRWRPPRGLSKDLVCQIKCSMGGSGTVVACKLEKSSGVLIYDMAARSAARAMTLDRWAWGKDFTIVFKQ